MTPQKYKAVREALGYTQQGAADALEVSREAITRRETGARPITREAWLALNSLPPVTPKK